VRASAARCDPSAPIRVQRELAQALNERGFAPRCRRREPGVGIGKPEHLGQNLSGYWSRRLTDEHRLVYTVDGNSLVIIQARYHY